jgi:transmembrane sensor
MNKIHQLPDAAGVEQKAGAWIARLHADDVTPDDLRRFDAWRAAHPRHMRAYEEMSGTIEDVKRAGRLVRAVSFGNAMNTASVEGGAVRRRRALAAAAAIAAIALVSIWWLQRTGSQTLFQTAIGEHASIELPDGSRLELNSNSVARVEYTRQARTIRLARGEAFFKVVHDPQKPFWVVAADSWIRAVGTAFSVDLRPSGMRVVVSEGTVKVAAARAGEEVPSDTLLGQAPVSVLTMGQQAQMKAGGAEIRAVAPLELTRLAAWRKGKLYFENQPLESVVEELERYTTSHITIEDDALRQLLIGGTFQANAQGADALLGMLQEGFGLHVRREGERRVYIEEGVAR